MTKYFGALPLKEETSETIAKQLTEQVILRFGLSEIIKTDLGSNLNSSLMMNVYKLLGINKYNTSPFHPLTNAALERCHKTFKTMLQDKKKSDWHSFIPYAVFVMNTSINRSTLYSPHQLLLDIQMEIPTNLKRKPDPIYTYDDYLSELR